MPPSGLSRVVTPALGWAKATALPSGVKAAHQTIQQL
jgi:hypothetical protein